MELPIFDFVFRKRMNGTLVAGNKGIGVTHERLKDGQSRSTQLDVEMPASGVLLIDSGGCLGHWLAPCGQTEAPSLPIEDAGSHPHRSVLEADNGFLVGVFFFAASRFGVDGLKAKVEVERHGTEWVANGLDKVPARSAGLLQLETQIVGVSAPLKAGEH